MPTKSSVGRGLGRQEEMTDERAELITKCGIASLKDWRQLSRIMPGPSASKHAKIGDDGRRAKRHWVPEIETGESAARVSAQSKRRRAFR